MRHKNYHNASKLQLMTSIQNNPGIEKNIHRIFHANQLDDPIMSSVKTRNIMFIVQKLRSNI